MLGPSVASMPTHTPFAGTCSRCMLHCTATAGDLWLKGDAKTTVLTVIKEGFQVLEKKVCGEAHTCRACRQRMQIPSNAGSASPRVAWFSSACGATRGSLRPIGSWVPLFMLHTARARRTAHGSSGSSTSVHASQPPTRFLTGSRPGCATLPPVNHTRTTTHKFMHTHAHTRPARPSVSQVHHRIFVVDPAKAHTVTVHDQTVVINIKPGTEKPEASGLRPTDIVTQMDVVKLLVEHKDKLELVKDKTLEELEIFEVGEGGACTRRVYTGWCRWHTRVGAGGMQGVFFGGGTGGEEGWTAATTLLHCLVLQCSAVRHHGGMPGLVGCARTGRPVVALGSAARSCTAGAARSMHTTYWRKGRRKAPTSAPSTPPHPIPPHHRRLRWAPLPPSLPLSLPPRALCSR